MTEFQFCSIIIWFNFNLFRIGRIGKSTRTYAIDRLRSNVKAANGLFLLGKMLYLRQIIYSTETTGIEIIVIITFQMISFPKLNIGENATNDKV